MIFALIMLSVWLVLWGAACCLGFLATSEALKELEEPSDENGVPPAS